MDLKSYEQNLTKLVITNNNYRNSEGKTKELEIIFKVNFEEFKKMFNVLQTHEHKKEIIKSVSISKHDELNKGRLRKEMFFTDTKKTSEILIRKSPLYVPVLNNNAGVPYKVSLKLEETQTKDIKFNDNSYVRLKMRASFLMSIDDIKWKIDMTITRSLIGNNAINSLRTIIDQMFSNKTFENFVEDLPGYEYEIEAELLNDNVKVENINVAVKEIQIMIDDKYLDKISVIQSLGELKKLIGTNKQNRDNLSIASILPGVYNLEYNDYKNTYYPPLNYYIMRKIDGKRTAIIYINGKCSVITSEKVFKYEVKSRTTSNSTADITLLDCEYVITHDGSEKIYAFDVCYIAGEDLRNETYENRMLRLDEAIDIIKTIPEINIDKQFMLKIDSIEDIKGKILEISSRPIDFETDGIIMVQPGKSYSKTISIKWKPAELNSVDVLVKKAPRSIVGKEPFLLKKGFTMYFLFVSINKFVMSQKGLKHCPGYDKIFGRLTTKKIPIALSFPSCPLAYIFYHQSDDLDGKILEVVATDIKQKYVNWNILKIRTDKMSDKTNYGNSYLTSLKVIQNYNNPFNMEYLWGEWGDDYFVNEKSSDYKSQTRFISFVKQSRIQSMKFANCVIDIGSGKGQDLFRYLKSGISHLIMIDKDKSALSELVSRRFNSNEDFKTMNTTLHVMNADINNPYTETIERMDVFGMGKVEANYIVCNLAFHYFCENFANIRNFIMLAKNLLIKGGKVILTILMGDVVFSLMKKNNVQVGETYDIMENSEPKYSIKKLYSSETLEICGQKIGVLLPFSNGQYYEEYLVNTKTIIREFKDNGFQLLENTSISSKLQEFNLSNSARLTEQDIQWISLYGELVFRLN